jgi:hypothetical protein
VVKIEGDLSIHMSQTMRPNRSRNDMSKEATVNPHACGEITTTPTSPRPDGARTIDGARARTATRAAETSTPRRRGGRSEGEDEGKAALPPQAQTHAAQSSSITVSRPCHGARPASSTTQTMVARDSGASHVHETPGHARPARPARVPCRRSLQLPSPVALLSGSRRAVMLSLLVL